MCFLLHIYRICTFFKTLILNSHQVAPLNFNAVVDKNTCIRVWTSRRATIQSITVHITYVLNKNVTAIFPVRKQCDNENWITIMKLFKTNCHHGSFHTKYKGHEIISFLIQFFFYSSLFLSYLTNKNVVYKLLLTFVHKYYT